MTSLRTEGLLYGGVSVLYTKASDFTASAAARRRIHRLPIACRPLQAMRRAITLGMMSVPQCTARWLVPSTCV